MGKFPKFLTIFVVQLPENQFIDTDRRRRFCSSSSTTLSRLRIRTHLLVDAKKEVSCGCGSR